MYLVSLERTVALADLWESHSYFLDQIRGRWGQATEILRFTKRSKSTDCGAGLDLPEGLDPPLSRKENDKNENSTGNFFVCPNFIHITSSHQFAAISNEEDNNLRSFIWPRFVRVKFPLLFFALIFFSLLKPPRSLVHALLKLIHTKFSFQT